MASFQGFEAECTDTYAFYQAEVIDSKKPKTNQNAKLLINWLPTGWKAQEWVDVARVRAAPQPVSASWRPRVGERLEVLNRAAEDEPDGWWPAKVKSISGSQYVIAYYGWEDDQYDSHVDLQDLRPTNTNVRLKSVDVSKYKRERPAKYTTPGAVEQGQRGKRGGGGDRDRRDNMDFDRAIRIIDTKIVDVAKVVQECQAYTHIDVTDRTWPDRRIGRAFLVIGTKKSAKKAVTIMKLDVDHAIKMEVEGEKKARAEGQIKWREERDAKFLDMCHEQFLVPEAVVRYVIGAKGSNIAAARDAVQGPAGDKFDEADQGKVEIEALERGVKAAPNAMATINIWASTLERVAAARELLDVQHLEKRIPSAYLGSIIGERGSKINEIKTTSEVFAIDIPKKDRDGPRDEFIDITIVGKPSCISMCESLIDRAVSQEDDLADIRRQTASSHQTLKDWGKRSDSNAIEEIDDGLADMSLASRAPTGSPLPEDEDEIPRDISPSPSPDPDAPASTEPTSKKKKRRRRKGRKA